MPLTLNGTTGIAYPNGSAGAPALTGADTDTGIVFGTDTLGLSTAGTQRLTIDSTGRVGIGTTNPTQTLHVVGNLKVNSIAGQASDTGATQLTHVTNTLDSAVVLWGKDHPNWPGQVHLVSRNSNAAAAAGEIIFWASDGAGNFFRNAWITKTGNLAFTNGKGIDFSATANSSGTMTSEVLSDYEEGSFSPTFDTWSGTYSKQFGRYVRIGSNVSLFGEVSTNGGTGSFGSFPGVGGFPFVGNVAGSAAKGMWFCVEGATNLGGHTASGPLDGPGNGGTSAFPNWIRVNDNCGNWANAQLNASVKVTYRFFIEYTTT